MITPSYTDASSVTLASGQRCLWWKYCHGYGVMVGMLRERFMMRRTSTSGRLSCLVWAQPSSAAAMCRSKRSDTDFFLSLGFPRKKEPSHCFITLSIFSVLKSSMFDIYISHSCSFFYVPLTKARMWGKKTCIYPLIYKSKCWLLNWYNSHSSIFACG